MEPLTGPAKLGENDGLPFARVVPVVKTIEFCKTSASVIARYMDEFLSGKPIAGGKEKGNPVHQEAWIPKERCFVFRKVIRQMSDENGKYSRSQPAMVIETRIYPEGWE